MTIQDSQTSKLVVKKVRKFNFQRKFSTKKIICIFLNIFDGPCESHWRLKAKHIGGVIWKSIVAQKSALVKCVLLSTSNDFHMVGQKMGILFENKLFQKLKLSENGDFLLNWYFEYQKYSERYRWFLMLKIYVESRIYALFSKPI